MEGSVMGAPLLSSSATGVLELHHHQQALAHHLQGLAPLSTTQQHMNTSPDSNQALGMESKCTPKVPLICSKGKSAGTSDEDELSFMEEGEDGHGAGKSRKSSPWQRMKWTDSMVKLLIHAVLFVGEDGVVESSDGNNKRKSGLLQKKGKWKWVSRVMMERGCYVSPQQCEDKFNDLNKRYKRLTDILGRGTACCVVENPSLLDTMENLSPKVKEDVKKILSSKHLFYKEMCDYHNGCKPSMSADLEFQPSFQASMMRKNRESLETGRSMKEENDMDAEEEDDAEEDDEEEDLDDHDEENGVYAEDGAAGDLPFSYCKRRKFSKYSEGNYGSFSNHTKCMGLEPMNSDMMLMMHDGSKLTLEQRQLMRTRMMQLEEHKVGLQAQALELEKQRFKWQRFNSKKARELERMKLENERMKLENDRMSLHLKQKELETECKRSEASMSSIAMILEKLQSKDQNELGRGQGIG